VRAAGPCCVTVPRCVTPLHTPFCHSLPTVTPYATTPRFQAERTIKTYAFHLNAPPRTVFPLLCPTREYEWIENWDCGLIYSDSGVAEENCIFTTRFAGQGGDEVWVVSHYEKDREIQFVRVNPLRVIRFSITLTASGDGATTAVWTHVATGLNEQGNEWVRQYTDEAFQQAVKSREEMLNHYLATGEMLRSAGTH
jgi:hypothetical protein